MAFSRSPKMVGAKFGFATAIALGSLPMLGAEASATPAILSDSLQLGTQTTQQLFEGAEGTSISDVIVFSSPTQNQSALTRVIALTEPGSTAISDIVTATISGAEQTFTLTVTLTSDTETPLTSAFDFSTAEIGAVQDLSTDFTRLFLIEVPSINVLSDTSDTPTVPEPGSLALLGAGLAGLALARRRKV
jgi:hypothetical protein